MYLCYVTERAYNKLTMNKSTGAIISDVLFTDTKSNATSAYVSDSYGIISYGRSGFDTSGTVASPFNDFFGTFSIGVSHLKNILAINYRNNYLYTIGTTQTATDTDGVLGDTVKSRYYPLTITKSDRTISKPHQNPEWVTTITSYDFDDNALGDNLGGFMFLELNTNDDIFIAFNYIGPLKIYGKLLENKTPTVADGVIIKLSGVSGKIVGVNTMPGVFLRNIQMDGDRLYITGTYTELTLTNVNSIVDDTQASETGVVLQLDTSTDTLMDIALIVS